METIQVKIVPPPKNVGPEIVKKILEPEVALFSSVFQKLSGTPLTGMEREVLKAYLYHKIINRKDA